MNARLFSSMYDRVKDGTQRQRHGVMRYGDTSMMFNEKGKEPRDDKRQAGTEASIQTEEGRQAKRRKGDREGAAAKIGKKAKRTRGKRGGGIKKRKEGSSNEKANNVKKEDKKAQQEDRLIKNDKLKKRKKKKKRFQQTSDDLNKIEKHDNEKESKRKAGKVPRESNEAERALEESIKVGSTAMLSGGPSLWALVRQFSPSKAGSLFRLIPFC